MSAVVGSGRRLVVGRHLVILLVSAFYLTVQDRTNLQAGKSRQLHVRGNASQPHPRLRLRVPGRHAKVPAASCCVGGSWRELARLGFTG